MLHHKHQRSYRERRGEMLLGKQSIVLATHRHCTSIAQAPHLRQAPEARPGTWSSLWETSNLMWSSQDFTTRDIVFRDLHQQLMLSSFSRVNAPSQRGTSLELLVRDMISRIIMCSFKAVAHLISLMPFIPSGLKFCDSKTRFQNSKNIFSL